MYRRSVRIIKPIDFMNLHRLRRRIRKYLPRHFHCFSVGAAKTGTTSIADMLLPKYRAQHEPEPARTVDLVIKHLSDEITDADVRDRLRKRDRRLRLELESSHPMGYLTPLLVDVFPDARFIITIREPRAWLASRLKFHFIVDSSEIPAWRPYRKYFWGENHDSFNKEEEVLQEYGLAPLSVYLKQYEEHYQNVMKAVPSERRLIIPTKHLDRALSQIACFLSLSPNEIEPSHRKKSPTKIDIINNINEEYVDQKIQKFYPNVIDLYHEYESCF